jgi:hypothetical protein
MKTDRREFLAGSLATLGSFAARGNAMGQPAPGPGTGVQLATFVADITPPMGEPLVFTSPPVRTVEHPLLAKGVVLRDAGGTYVLCALDWCEIHGETYNQFREKIAKAAGTSPSRVAVQTLHQHTAPAYDTGAQQMLNKLEGAPPQKGLEFLEEATTRTAAAVSKAMAEWKDVTQVGTGWASVDQLASSRRILQPDGKILTRLSSSKNPEEQRAQEGYIDCYLRTITFFAGEQPVARMYYYATHPQSYYNDGRVTYDVPGIARERLEKETGVFQVYFTGCGGDIGMGKYNDGTPERRPILVDRLYDGMVRSVRKVERQPLSGIEWKTVDVRFPVRSDGPFSEQACHQVLADPKANPMARLNAAWALDRAARNQPIQLSCMALGSVRVLHLPGEPFIEYQLWAQHRRPDLFVAVAGFGDCTTGYICTNQAYSDHGGYEQTESFVAPSEEILKGAMGKLLGTPTGGA